MRFRTFTYSLATLLACQSLLCAAEENTFANLLNHTKQEYEKGNYDGAYTTLTQIGIHIFEKMPLKLADFKIVEKPAEGYGVYTQRENNVYKADEPIYIYCEPRGYVFKKRGDEYHFGLSTDFSVSDDNGHVLGGQNDFGKFELVSHQPSLEFILNLTYSLSGLEPGVYKIHTTAKDPNSGKSTTETIEIKVEK